MYSEERLKAHHRLASEPRLCSRFAGAVCRRRRLGLAFVLGSVLILCASGRDTASSVTVFVLILSLNLLNLHILLRARSVLMEPSAEMDPARNRAVFYTVNHHQEMFRSGISLNERALSWIAITSVPQFVIEGV